MSLTPAVRGTRADPGEQRHSPLAPAAWWAGPLDELARELASDTDLGLTTEEAARRLELVGPNRLDEVVPRPRWLVFLDQFRNALVAILLIGAVVAAATGDVKDTVAIAVVLVLNATLGYVHERRAQRGVDALRALLSPTARVRRGGTELHIQADGLVPGDIVLLEAGDCVPAEGRIADSWSATVDESALTGESFPAAKAASDGLERATPLGDRSNCVFTNTTVTRGRLVVVVTATGMATELGQVAGMVSAGPRDRTPLQRQLDTLGKRLALISAVVVAGYFAIGLATGDPFAATVLSSVALLVAAVPEGLPAVVTVTLALGTGRLAEHGAIVKRLASVESLGSTTVILTDKTGTLTANEMSVRHAAGWGWTLDLKPGALDDPHLVPAYRALVEEIGRLAALCNDSVDRPDSAAGDPTETALVSFARDAGVDIDATRASRPRLGEIPFDPDAKFMGTIHTDAAHPGEALLALKGAWDVLAPSITAVAAAEGDLPVDAAILRDIDDRVDAMGSDGLRVLAVASRWVSQQAVEAASRQGLDGLHRLVGELRLAGLVGMADPPRPEAMPAIARCRRAGIGVKMVTGDHLSTARAIARELGITGEAIDGAALDQLDDAVLAERIGGIGVVARVAPHHKVRLAQALRARGEIVTMTGDGVNDAPALTVADLGVAMGSSGTDVAREAADMVLTDDNFATIAHAVEEGRVLYENILKFVRFQVATNIGALTTFIGAELAALPTPFTPVQVLWINLIMDGPPAMALGFDPGSPEVMDRPPRPPGEQILGRGRLRRIALAGVVMAAGTLAVLAWALAQYDEVRALSIAFTTFVLFQIANALNVRDEEATVFRRATLRNYRLWVALACVMVLQVIAIYVAPIQRLFGTTALSGADWLVAIVTASSLVVVEELRKALHRALTNG